MKEESKKKFVIFAVIILLAIVVLVCWLLFGRETSYEITVNDGTSVRVANVYKNAYMTRPNDPVREGYNFLGWYNGEQLFDFENTPITADVELVAKWEVAEAIEENSYVVIFNTDGGNNIPNVIVDYGDTVPEPDDPVKDGYTFVKWVLNGRTYDFDKEVTSNLILVAKWAENKKEEVKPQEQQKQEQKPTPQPKTTKYTVSFDTDGGNSISNQSIEKGKKVTVPTAPTKSGYTFVEWQLNGQAYNFENAVNSNITLKAVWEKVPVYYTVSYNTNGGSTVNPTTVLEGKAVGTAPSTSKAGYTFKEWQLNGQAYNFENAVNSNITLKAVWEKVPVYYTVSYNTNGGSTVNPTTVLEGKAVGTAPSTSKARYTFKEWQMNGNTYNFNSAVSGNITLNAIWDTYSFTAVDTGEPGAVQKKVFIYKNGVDITSSVTRVLDASGNNLGKYQASLGAIAVNINNVSNIKMILLNGVELYVQ